MEVRFDTCLHFVQIAQISAPPETPIGPNGAAPPILLDIGSSYAGAMGAMDA